MPLFETLVMLGPAALLLLGLSRRLSVPYPTMIALAGVAFAALPQVPEVPIDPQLMLALFIAPALLQAAYESSPRGLLQHWLPLTALAVVAVLLTAGAVMLVGIASGLTAAAALTLGAIVAPPDAAAANAVLTEVGLPRRSFFVLQGESLLNDATALLLFGIALSWVGVGASVHSPATLAFAAPGGILLGLAAATLYLRLLPRFAGTLAVTLVDLWATFAVWLLADRLHLSPVLAVVAFAMLSAQRKPARQAARDRIQSASVWSAAVFVLNVIAFLLMGLQAREVLGRLTADERLPALGFALAVLATVILVRIGWVLLYRFTTGQICRRMRKPLRWMPEPVPWRVAALVSWSGMRGLLTLAAAFSLPEAFPQRDRIVLAAFCVVLGTLVLQGLTIAPLTRLFGVKPDGSMEEEVAAARRTLVDTALAAIDADGSREAAALRPKYRAAGHVADRAEDPQGATRYDEAHSRIVAAQRQRLEELRRDGDVADDVYRRLEEELDWAEIDASPFADNVLREA